MNTSTTNGKRPQLTVVGAGPGDPELITVKALKAISSADVVLYDALVSPEILALIPPHVLSYPVGKRAGRHSVTQEQINDLIVECARMHGHVVRLKGGDPFVFGRGMEEIAHALEHGLETAIVPGITSAVAVPAALDIPVTARGVSESFWVVTGTTVDGAVSADLALAARSSATVVVLMGLNRIAEMMQIFSREGRSDTPAAVIQNGTLPSQQAVVGTVSTIADLVRQENIQAPAVVIVGQVVKYARDLRRLAGHAIKDFQ